MLNIEAGDMKSKVTPERCNQLIVDDREQRQTSYLEREPRLATVGWQAGHSHSPAGMRYSAGRRQNRWKALLHSSQRISFSSSP